MVEEVENENEQGGDIDYHNQSQTGSPIDSAPASTTTSSMANSLTSTPSMHPYASLSHPPLQSLNGIPSSSSDDDMRGNSRDNSLLSIIDPQLIGITHEDGTSIRMQYMNVQLVQLATGLTPVNEIPSPLPNTPSTTSLIGTTATSTATTTATGMLAALNVARSSTSSPALRTLQTSTITNASSTTHGRTTPITPITAASHPILHSPRVPQSPSPPPMMMAPERDILAALAADSYWSTNFFNPPPVVATSSHGTITNLSRSALQRLSSPGPSIPIVTSSSSSSPLIMPADHLSQVCLCLEFITRHRDHLRTVSDSLEEAYIARLQLQSSQLLDHLPWLMILPHLSIDHPIRDHIHFTTHVIPQAARWSIRDENDYQTVLSSRSQLIRFDREHTELQYRFEFENGKLDRFAREDAALAARIAARPPPRVRAPGMGLHLTLKAQRKATMAIDAAASAAKSRVPRLAFAHIPSAMLLPVNPHSILARQLLAHALASSVANDAEEQLKAEANAYAESLANFEVTIGANQNHMQMMMAVEVTPNSTCQMRGGMTLAQSALNNTIAASSAVSIGNGNGSGSEDPDNIDATAATHLQARTLTDWRTKGGSPDLLMPSISSSSTPIGTSTPAAAGPIQPSAPDSRERNSSTRPPSSVSFKLQLPSTSSASSTTSAYSRRIAPSPRAPSAADQLYGGGSGGGGNGGVNGSASTNDGNKSHRTGSREHPESNGNGVASSSVAFNLPVPPHHRNESKEEHHHSRHTSTRHSQDFNGNVNGSSSASSSSAPHAPLSIRPSLRSGIHSHVISNPEFRSSHPPHSSSQLTPSASPLAHAFVRLTRALSNATLTDSLTHTPSRALIAATSGAASTHAWTLAASIAASNAAIAASTAIDLSFSSPPGTIPEDGPDALDTLMPPPPSLPLDASTLAANRIIAAATTLTSSTLASKLNRQTRLAVRKQQFACIARDMAYEREALASLAHAHQHHKVVCARGMSQAFTLQLTPILNGETAQAQPYSRPTRKRSD